MTDQKLVWGAGPSPRFDALADRFRPIFRRIRERAVDPRIYHDRTVGHFAVHGTIPPRQMGIGITKETGDAPKGIQFAS